MDEEEEDLGPFEKLLALEQFFCGRNKNYLGSSLFSFDLFDFVCRKLLGLELVKGSVWVFFGSLSSEEMEKIHCKGLVVSPVAWY